MALTLKTPGVFVEEISKFPPSIAEVATAIPAFIGYTAIAKNKINGDLNLVPTRITSLLEYEKFFGFAANEDKISVNVEDGVITVHEPTHSERKPFLMYYSLQMYFANGGGPCYITSVGQYTGDSPVTQVQFAELKAGLDEIKKQDEPTLLLFPDATFLANEPQFYALFTAALEQSQELQDRFTLIDTFTDSSTSIAALRAGITDSQDALKYGAAYYPSLKTILNYRYEDSQIKVTDVDAPTFATQVTTISNSIKPEGLTTLLSQLDARLALLMGITSPSAGQLLAAKNDLAAKVAEIQQYMSTTVAKLTNVVGIGDEAITENSDPGGALQTALDALDLWSNNFLTDPSVNITDNLLPDLTGGNDKDEVSDAVDAIKDAIIFSGVALATKIATLKATGELPAIITILGNPIYANEDAFLSSYELNNNVMYNRIKAEISKVNIVLPPSSSMAGIYARVDGNSGVWTAPANASVNYVIAPTVFIDNEMQEDMNVTPTGKSVNAIRSFTGRGTLVWGARTLTGNSNEWRYVPVRRFFNMVEESTRKATEQFVFQGNNANTWVKIKGMIEAYLTLQWKAGALTGAKPEQAFYVSVGLGQTMTAQDILEGKMIIEIGMAVVRPAEFIVLQFSHKMQEA